MESIADNMARAARVRLLIVDVDGVLTDGSLHFGPDGEIVKTFHAHDGLGIRLLRQAGVPTALISARASAIVASRAADLGIDHVCQGCPDKVSPFLQLLATTGLDAGQCAFIGDDLNDMALLKRVGFAIAVPSGRPEVLACAHHVTQAAGGRGAVREVCEFLLRAQGRYDAVLAPFLGAAGETP